MLLVLFDIDGTLTDTFGVDTDCFVRAIRDEFGIPNINTDWSTYPDATDSAIFNHVFSTQFARNPTDHEIARMKGGFVSKLTEVFENDPRQCLAITGGTQFVESIVRENHCAVGFATGGWECSARLKLRVAGYNARHIPMATADDSTRRTDICAIAVDLARHRHGVEDFDEIVYIGDGIWDAETARKLGFRFIGRGSDNSAFNGLEPEFVVHDFTELKLLQRVLARQNGCRNMP